MITEETIPALYELSWKPEVPAIVLRVHRDFIAQMEPIPEDSPGLIDLTREFGFTKFERDFAIGFGFDDSFERVGERDGFVEFLIRLPDLVVIGEACDSCNGSGKREEESDEACLYCDGVGKKKSFNFKPARAISASLTIFFKWAYLFEGRTSARDHQLMIFETMTERCSDGSAFRTEYGAELVDYLRGLGAGIDISPLIVAMKVAHGRMLGAGRSEHEFMAPMREVGVLHLSCPGNRCGLDPGWGDKKPGKGYESSTHNCDSPAQQLTLIVGLAALHDLARQTMK